MGKARNSTKPPLTEAQKQQKKRDNFTRVATPRINKALKAIGLVGDCTSSNYSFTEEQATAIMLELHRALDAVSARFKGEPGKSGGFTLPK